MRLVQKIRSLRKSLSPYRPQIEILVYKDSILHNLTVYQKAASPALVAPVIKSNAYGHGLALVAEILDTRKIPFLVVDSLYEANLLRREGIRTPILVVGYTLTGNMRYAKKCISFVVGSVEQLEEIKEHNIRATIHIKIDTGMHRQGIMSDDIERSIVLAQNAKKITVEGVCSHFADADGDTDDYSKKQIALWNSSVQKFKKAFPTLAFWHLAASAGVRLSRDIDANVVRLGKGLYGTNPVERWPVDLQPALEMRAVISSIRTLPPGERIGYNGTYATTRETKVATVPVGYYEGVDRRLSNKGVFLVRDHACPILGRVSMNITSIDVTGIPDIHIGEPVTVISADTKAPNNIVSIAKLCGTITYEVVTRIPAHLSRKII